MKHPIHELNDDVHQRVRLGILASLHGVAETDVAFLKTSLELTDGNLGRHLQALEDAGLIRQKRVTGEGRPRTWVRITRQGRLALAHEVRALQRLLAEIEPIEAPEAQHTPQTEPG